MALSILMSQKTKRHIVKKLDSTYTYVSKFGTFGTSKTDNTGLNNPIGIAADASNNIYICDSKNSRIIKLDSNLAYIGSLDLDPSIIPIADKRNHPYVIMFDSLTGDLYVVGVYKDLYMSIFRITTALAIVKSNNNVYSEAKEKPYSICRGFGGNDFIVSLGKKLIKITEDTGTTFTATTSITSETINASHNEAIIREKKYNLVNKPIVLGTYTLWRTYTEAPTEISTTTFQTLHFPVLGTPDVDFKVYKNEVELDYVPVPVDPNDYTINQALGFITLKKAVISTDEIYIRYKFQMIDAVDYELNINTGSIKLTDGVSEDWNFNRDIIESDYTYTGQGVIQTISGISDATITGLVHHTNNDIYVAQNTLTDAGKISRVNSSYVNIGDTNKISKFVLWLSEALDGSLLTYCDSEKIVRYSDILNYIEDVYVDKKEVDEPPVLLGSHQYQLSLFPVVSGSERVYTGTEVLLFDAYTLNPLTGLLTIKKVTDNPVTIVVYGLSYQLSKFPIEVGSESVYVDNVLQLSGYTLDYVTGRLTFSPIISGTVKVEYYRDISIDKVEFNYDGEVVELDAYDVSGIIELNI